MMALLILMFNLSKIQFGLLKRKWQNCLGKEGRLLQNTFKMFFWKTNWFKNQPVGNSDKFAAREIAMWSAKDYIITWT